jgi:hypothetical protein
VKTTLLAAAALIALVLLPSSASAATCVNYATHAEAQCASGSQKGLVRGINPIGWMADVMYVRSSENRSHGSSLGSKLRRFCNGVRFRYVFAR